MSTGEIKSLGIADQLLSALGAPAYFNKDSKIGDSVTGRVVTAAFRQSRDYDDNTPEFWADDTPKLQLAVMLETDLEPTSAEDTGDRSVFIKWWGQQRKDFAAAVLRTGNSSDLETGGVLTVTFTGLGEAQKLQSGKMGSAPKLYSFEYTAPGK